MLVTGASASMGTAAVDSGAGAFTTDVLFRTIEEWHCRDGESGTTAAATPWSEATVLDAGTGRSSLRWLVNGVQAHHITAVTADSARAMGLRNEFSMLDSSGDSDKSPVPGRGCDGHGATRGGEIQIGSWVPSSGLSRPPLDSDAAYDVVLADYLLGAMDVFTPFAQQGLFPALVELMRPGAGARLYVIGLQPLPDKSGVDYRDEGARLLSELVRTRDACITLAGHRPHREYPLEWVRTQLEASGLVVARTRSFPNIYRAGRTKQPLLYVCADGLRGVVLLRPCGCCVWFDSSYSVDGIVRTATTKLRFFGDKQLARAMRARVLSLQAAILQHLAVRRSEERTRQPAGIQLGFDYIVEARRPQ